MFAFHDALTAKQYSILNILPMQISPFIYCIKINANKISRSRLQQTAD